MEKLTHINEQGRAKMVDVSGKPVTRRVAVARARVCMKPETLSRIRLGNMEKGDVLAVAQVAGIMAAKKTSELIPMCHPIPLRGVDLRFSEEGDSTLVIEAEVKTDSVTGVEMEALTAVSVAALTVYDMCKAIDKEITVEQTCLIRKTGGKSGDFIRKGE
ncbi:cyclic pyranopterin monophosphate synthase MoaC [Polycladomyces subterraneus]|uniref:Cyclic pyranopterin monophosphate synthase n=1 Tax=Polycladomyces subterraneus TaxID=1016997 RepID=A0ABT8IPA3_9BACL|nr:cyclic pyranopterin monophosphate synthase MoaC [Polycladomyces subterraneus]MDN4594582.1 cyclic pyranopterin monophosphate synthase MoaC [Polycladomyces subterraneus]